MSGCSIGTDRHLNISFGMQVIESSSLDSVLFRKALNNHLIFSFTNKYFFCFVFPYFSYFLLIGGQRGIKMASASTPSVLSRCSVETTL